MQKYYYATNDKVYSTWSDVDMKNWLAKRGIIKSEAQLSRDKLAKLLEYVCLTYLLHVAYVVQAETITQTRRTPSGARGPTAPCASGSLSTATSVATRSARATISSSS